MPILYFIPVWQALMSGSVRANASTRQIPTSIFESPLRFIQKPPLKIFAHQNLIINYTFSTSLI